MRTFTKRPDKPQKQASSLAAVKIAPPVLRSGIGNEAELSCSPRSSFGHDFSRIPIHSPGAGAIQTKLAINEPGDAYEHEAERIAQQVMRMPQPQLQRACACDGTCSKCKTEQQQQIQRKSFQTSEADNGSAPPIVHNELRSPGQPLDAQTRAFFVSPFGKA